LTPSKLEALHLREEKLAGFAFSLQLVA